MGGTSRLGMLLGPEDTGHSHPRLRVWWGVFLLVAAFCRSSRRSVWGTGLVGGLLENCTVDASIFDLLWSSF